MCRGPEQAEETFNDFSIDERGKFEQETLVNVTSSVKIRRVVGADADTPGDYILVTILAAADGDGLKMPDITDATDLKTALKRLAAVRVEALQAVEVLWTPPRGGRRPHPNRALTRLPHPRQSLAATFALRDARVVKNHPTVTLTSIVRVRSITAPLSAPSRARAGTPARIFHESNGHFPTSHH